MIQEEPDVFLFVACTKGVVGPCIVDEGNLALVIAKRDHVAVHFDGGQQRVEVLDVLGARLVVEIDGAVAAGPVRREEERHQIP